LLDPLITSVIFDIDGTLVDSNDLHAHAWQEAFRHFGCEVSYAEVRQQIGKGADQTLPVFLSPRQIAEFGEQLEKYKSQVYRQKYMSQAQPFPRVRELFERLHRDNKRIALCTSADPEELDHNKSLLGVNDLVDAETSAGDAERTKPFPDIFFAGLKKLGNPPPETVVVVGDSPYDAQAASQVPLGAIAVLCGGFSEEQLRGAGCKAIYRDPADLLAHYEDSPITESGGAD
jgi:HAD superfamily hydrolase (TIGR01509 family)